MYTTLSHSVNQSQPPRPIYHNHFRRSPKWSLSLQFPNKNYVLIYTSAHLIHRSNGLFGEKYKLRIKFRVTNILRLPGAHSVLGNEASCSTETVRQILFSQEELDLFSRNNNQDSFSRGKETDLEQPRQ
jgi:hypothetical protein